MRTALLASCVAVCALMPAHGAGGIDADAVPQAQATGAALLRTRAFDAAYNLDDVQAVALFTDALAAEPDDVAAHRGIAIVQWLQITFVRGTFSVDEFLGDVAPGGTLPPAPPDRARTFRTHADRAVQVAEAQVVQHPKDAEAHYQLGAAIGLRASYMATIEGRIFAAFRSARRAYDEHERVLALDPRRKDAGLILGTYRYLVSTLAAPTRLMAYLAGFGGGRERGLALLEDAARYPSDAQTEAKLALLLLYNRERRFDEALRVVADLRCRYPRNRLLWLESASTALRARHVQDAEALLADASRRFAGDTRPRAFGEAALWHYTGGLVRLERGDLAGARRELLDALDGDARPWVRARAHLALGKVLDRTGDHAGARVAYENAARLGELGRDPATTAEARRLRAHVP